eukprot:Rmarinus@m.3652
MDAELKPAGPLGISPLRRRSPRVSSTVFRHPGPITENRCGKPMETYVSPQRRSRRRSNVEIHFVTGRGSDAADVAFDTTVVNEATPSSRLRRRQSLQGEGTGKCKREVGIERSGVGHSVARVVRQRGCWRAHGKGYENMADHVFKAEQRRKCIKAGYPLLDYSNLRTPEVDEDLALPPRQMKTPLPNSQGPQPATGDYDRHLLHRSVSSSSSLRLAHDTTEGDLTDTDVPRHPHTARAEISGEGRDGFRGTATTRNTAPRSPGASQVLPLPPDERWAASGGGPRRRAGTIHATRRPSVVRERRQLLESLLTPRFRNFGATLAAKLDSVVPPTLTSPAPPNASFKSRGSASARNYEDILSRSARGLSMRRRPPLTASMTSTTAPTNAAGVGNRGSGVYGNVGGGGVEASEDVARGAGAGDARVPPKHSGDRLRKLPGPIFQVTSVVYPDKGPDLEGFFSRRDREKHLGDLFGQKSQDKLPTFIEPDPVCSRPSLTDIIPLLQSSNDPTHDPLFQPVQQLNETSISFFARRDQLDEELTQVLQRKEKNRERIYRKKLKLAMAREMKSQLTPRVLVEELDLKCRISEVKESLSAVKSCEWVGEVDEILTHRGTRELSSPESYVLRQIHESSVQGLKFDEAFLIRLSDSLSERDHQSGKVQALLRALFLKIPDGVDAYNRWLRARGQSPSDYQGIPQSRSVYGNLLSPRTPAFATSTIMRTRSAKDRDVDATVSVPAVYTVEQQISLKVPWTPQNDENVTTKAAESPKSPLPGLLLSEAEILSNSPSASVVATVTTGTSVAAGNGAVDSVAAANGAVDSVAAGSVASVASAGGVVCGETSGNGDGSVDSGAAKSMSGVNETTAVRSTSTPNSPGHSQVPTLVLPDVDYGGIGDDMETK